MPKMNNYTWGNRFSVILKNCRHRRRGTIALNSALQGFSDDTNKQVGEARFYFSAVTFFLVNFRDSSATFVFMLARIKKCEK